MTLTSRQSNMSSRALPSKGRSFARVLAPLGEILPALAVVAALLICWEVACYALGVPEYFLPRPSDFAYRMIADYQVLLRHALATSIVIALSFAVSVLVAVPLALSITSVRILQEGLYPLIVFLKIVPKTIIGPILIVVFGFGLAPKVLLAAMIAFFPILVDSMLGFRSVDPRVFYLTKSMGAAPTQVFWWVRIPSALPYIFTGMRIGLVGAVTGAIIAEFFGSSDGLGFLILRASGEFDASLMFAAIVYVAVVGVAFNQGLTFLERLSVPWKNSAHQ